MQHIEERRVIAGRTVAACGNERVLALFDVMFKSMTFWLVFVKSYYP
jgi:hypothetical protein